MESLENIQQTKYKSELYLLLAFLGYFVALLLVIFGIIFSTIVLPTIGVILATLSFFAQTFFKKRLVQVKEDYLIKVLKPSIEQRFKEGKYNPNKGLDEMFFEGNKVIPLYDLYRSRHLIRGFISKYPFKSSYVRVEQLTEKFKRLERNTIFEGKAIDLEFTLPFKYDNECLHPKDPTRKKRKKRIDVVEFYEDYIVDGIEESKVKEMFSQDVFEAIASLIKKHRHVAIYFYYNHMVVLINDGRDMVDLGSGKQISEELYNRVDELFTDIETLVKAIESSKSMFA